MLRRFKSFMTEDAASSYRGAFGRAKLKKNKNPFAKDIKDPQAVKKPKVKVKD